MWEELLEKANRVPEDSITDEEHTTLLATYITYGEFDSRLESPIFIPLNQNEVISCVKILKLLENSQFPIPTILNENGKIRIIWDKSILTYTEDMWVIMNPYFIRTFKNLSEEEIVSKLKIMLPEIIEKQ